MLKVEDGENEYGQIVSTTRDVTEEDSRSPRRRDSGSNHKRGDIGEHKTHLMCTR